MSLSRVVRFTRQCPIVTLSPRRGASFTGNDEHSKHRETHEHPKEAFSGSFWRNTVLCSLLAATVYKYAPEPTDDAYLTRWIALYTTPGEVWTELATKHTAQSLEASQTRLVISNAQRPIVHRYRYPQMFEHKSPFLSPVGMDVDITDLVIKGDKD